MSNWCAVITVCDNIAYVAHIHCIASHSHTAMMIDNWIIEIQDVVHTLLVLSRQCYKNNDETICINVDVASDNMLQFTVIGIFDDLRTCEYTINFTLSVPVLRVLSICDVRCMLQSAYDGSCMPIGA